MSRLNREHSDDAGRTAMSGGLLNTDVFRVRLSWRCTEDLRARPSGGAG